MTHPEDAALILDFVAGDAKAAEQVRRWIALYVNFKGFGIREQEDRNDIAEDAWAAAWKTLKEGRFRGESRLKTYVQGIAFKKILDFLGKPGNKMRMQPLPQDDLYPDRARRQDEVFEQIEELDRVLSAISALPERCRELIRLRAAEEPPWSFLRIAKLFGVKENLVRYWLYQCRRGLKKLLAEPGVPPATGEAESR